MAVGFSESDELEKDKTKDLREGEREKKNCIY